jgi:hypothetical protein
MTRLPIRTTLGALIVAACLCVAGGAAPEQTEAAWTDGIHDSLTLSTGVVNPVTSFTCQAGSGFLDPTVGFLWTQPVITGNGLTPSAYEMQWTGAGTGITAPITALAGDLSVGLLTIGTFTVRVRAVTGTWTSAWSTQSRTVTVITSLLWNCS